jgi:hypothetical protein
MSLSSGVYVGSCSCSGDLHKLGSGYYFFEVINNILVAGTDPNRSFCPAQHVLK